VGARAPRSASAAGSRRNARYLPGIELPARSSWRRLRGAGARGDGLVIIATPMAGLRAMLAARARRGARALAVQGLRGRQRPARHEIARACARTRLPACCRARALPRKSRAASRPRWLRPAPTRLREAAAEAFHTESLRVYTSADAVGVEVGGAVKNVMAIATGLCDGLACARQAPRARPQARRLITRGLAEMTRLGVALGARPRPSWACPAWATWCSPPPATCRATAGRPGPGRGPAAGARAGRARPCRRRRAQRTGGAGARARGGVEMPITEAVVALLEGRASVPDAVRGLMGRGPRAEG
jgi:glycerol-3-phosphate dehydrogenase (NAD(P)+)